MTNSSDERQVESSPLRRSSILHGNHIRDNNHTQTVDTSSSDTGDGTAAVEHDGVRCEATKQVPDGEEGESAEENNLATKDVTQTR